MKQVLRVILAQKKLTIVEASKRCNVSRETFRKILNFDHKPTMKTVYKLSKGLGVKPEAFMSG
jgi:transcriptional regulator with XRE-family HTH domain